MARMLENTELLDGIAVFVAVVNAGSFTAAAKQLGHSTSYVSKEVTRLEKRLASRLLNRTTRTISLTDAGKSYFERCSQIVIDAENAERSISHLQDTPRGLLRINAPMSFGLNYLCEYLPEFAKLYPELRLEVEFNDRMIDVIAEGFDVVIRAGQIDNSNLVARKFLSSKAVVVASPEYLKRNGRPNTPAELKHHDQIVYSLAPNPSSWEFYKEDEGLTINLDPRIICNNAEIEMAMVKKGVGIAILPMFICEQDIASGEVEVILGDYDTFEIGVYAVYPHRQYLTPKVRVFVDFIVDKFTDSD